MPNKKPAERTYPVEVIDAAMCAWEHVFEQITASEGNKWQRQSRRVGIAAVRWHVMEMAEQINEAYQIALAKGFDCQFDWDFVPEFLDAATDDHCLLFPTWQLIAREIGKDHPE